MSVVRGALSARRLIEENSALALLRSANAPVAVAILGGHLAGETREMPAAELFEATEADLTELRDTAQFDVPQTAVQYVRTWLTQGFLIRRAGQAREEFYALSEGALAAIRFVEELSAPRSSVTESRQNEKSTQDGKPSGGKQPGNETTKPPCGETRRRSSTRRPNPLGNSWHTSTTTPVLNNYGELAIALTGVLLLTSACIAITTALIREYLCSRKTGGQPHVTTPCNRPPGSYYGPQAPAAATSPPVSMTICYWPFAQRARRLQAPSCR